MTHRPSLVPFIRDAVLSDRPAIVEFNRRLAIETEDKALEMSVLDRGVGVALADPERLRYWVAELPDNPGLVGQVAVSREWSDWRDGWIWWLQSVYVVAEFRGNGIFKALYQHVYRKALEQRDVVGMRLYVEDSNLRAQRTYQALGMKPVGYSVLEEMWLREAQEG